MTASVWKKPDYALPQIVWFLSDWDSLILAGGNSDEKNNPPTGTSRDIQRMMEHKTV